VVVTSGAVVSARRYLTLVHPSLSFWGHVSRKESYVEACIRTHARGCVTFRGGGGGGCGESGTNLFVPAGANIQGPVAGKADLPKGKTKWQCCIHPWMRSEVTVR
jgi:hypothetical protein